MTATTLPSQPTSSPLDDKGQWRPEWRVYLAAVDRILRRLNI